MDVERPAGAGAGAAKPNPKLAWKRPTRKSMLRAAQREDRQASALLCETYYDSVYGIVQSYGLKADRARDVTQSVFTHLFRRDLRRYDPNRSFRAWFRTVVHREICNFFKSERRVARREIHGLDLEHPGTSVESTQTATPPDRARDQRKALELLERAWDRLRRERYADKPTLFEHLKQSLSAEPTARTDAELCTELGQCSSYVGVARQRVKDRELPKALVAELLAMGVSKHRVREELRALASVLLDASP